MSKEEKRRQLLLFNAWCLKNRVSNDSFHFAIWLGALEAQDGK